MKFKAKLTTAVVFVAAGLISFEPQSTFAFEGNKSFCISYSEGGVDCGFSSLAQCNATAAGMSAECSSAPSIQQTASYAMHRSDKPQEHVVVSAQDRKPER